MGQNNTYLDKLLSVKKDLEQSNLRLNSLENGQIFTLDDVDNYLIETRNNHASVNDFLTDAQIEAINRDFNESLNKGIECSALDYALAAGSGVLCGLIDLLFVKTPHDGIFGKNADSLLNKKMIELSNRLKKTEIEKKIKDGINVEFKEITNVKSAIAYLESKFPVPYDQKATQEIKKDLVGDFEETIYHVSADNHHAKSLSHYPDIFGLISSICNQLTDTSTFLDNENGRIQIVNGGNNGFELKGKDLPSKIWCGFLNWFFHCLSDINGSSGSKGIGQGLPAPFTEFFQFCNFGKFPNEKGQYQTLATVMTKVYEEGYDVRHQAACSLPVILNDLITKSVFVIKEHFYNKKEWLEILPDKDFKQKLNRLSTVSIGTMCAVDLGEAVITSFGEPAVFLSHLNITAWSRLGLQSVKELKMLSQQEMNNINNIAKEVDEEWNNLLLKSQKLIDE